MRLIFASLLLVSFPYRAAAQAPPVPPVFQDLYSSLDTYLVNFNATLNAGPLSQLPALPTGNLKNANANAGPQLVNAGAMSGIQVQLQELKAMGMKAILVEVGFPMLYEPFLTGQGQSYAQFVSFYQQIGAMIHAAGMKVIVENDTLLTNDVQAGWDAAPFYATLDWTQYQQARAQTAVTIAQTMQPDYLVVLEEPTTEANDSGQTEADTVAGSVSLLSEILGSVRQAGVPGMLVGAGSGTAQANPPALSFIQQYVTLPLDFIDFHIYPINRSYLPIALQIASTAAAAGMPVSMTECWLWKVRDNELPPVLTNDQIRARNPFDFWAPLDAYFLQTMQNLAEHTQMLFWNPFNTELFAAYLPYDDATENLTPSEILGQESAQASQNVQQALFTSTALSDYSMAVTPPDTVPPAVPAGLAGSSNNPNTATVSWNASADNVGVAGYYVLRNGTVAGTTANMYYQDSGLLESTTYAYSVEAFDLGGNVSAASLAVHVTTADVTPPSTPKNLVATATSCQKVTLAWSPSTDQVGVGSYLVFWGISPGALVQVGRTPGSVTAYTSYPLTCGTTYYYGVEAADTSGNASPMSAIVSVTTPNPPAPPQNVVATPAAMNKIGLTWSAAAGGGLPVQYYHVLRGSTATNLAQVAILSQTSYTDSSLTPSTAYFYAVQSSDTGSDLSPMSSIVQATTPEAPGVPGNLVVTPQSTGKVGLSWSAAASGGLPIQNYHVFRGTTLANLAQLAISLQTSYTDSSVTAGARYYYAVASADSGSDQSPLSAAVAVTVPSAPGAPTGLAATPVNTAKISLAWSAAASGGLPIQNYHVYRGSTPANLSQVAIVLQTSYTDTAVTAGALYYYAAAAADSGNDLSPMSAPVAVTVPSGPAAPAGLAAAVASTSKISLTWLVPPCGGLAIRNYAVFRGTTPSALGQIATTAQPSYSDNGLAAATKYYYAVQASDTGSDVSPMSVTISATTLALPSPPTNLAATAPNKVQVNLTWTAARSGMPLASYTIFRGSSPANLSSLKVVLATQTSANDSTVSAGVTYYYAMQSKDTGGNLSPLSAAVSITTP